MSVQVTPVRSLGDLKAFVDLPYRLHAGTVWVPPLKLERYLFLSRRVNAFFKHGRAQYFLARRDGRVVGRISAQINDAYNDYHQDASGMFGFLEFEDDLEVVTALLGAAEAWLRALGRDRMLGPMDFTMNEESGVLIDGFERAPMTRQPWQPPYYQARLEEAGLAKAVDLYSWELELADRDSMRPIMFKLAEQLEDKHGIRIRKMSRRHLRREMDEFATVYNSAWARNWGFWPYGKADLDALAEELQLVYDRDWFMIAENDTETVAMAITFPDINQVLARMKGRLLPLGWWHFLRRNRIMESHPRRLSRRAPGVRAHRRGRRAVRRALRRGRAHAPQARGDGLDPGDQPPDEPGHGAHERADRQALPGLRARVRQPDHQPIRISPTRRAQAPRRRSHSSKTGRSARYSVRGTATRERRTA